MSKSRRAGAHLKKLQKEQTTNAIISIVLVMVLGAVLVLYFWQFWSVSSLQGLKRFSNADHGATIYEFARNVAEEAHEHVGLFLTDGTKILEYTTDDEIAVALPDEALAQLRQSGRDDLIAIHNHPGLETPFSNGDLAQVHAHSPYCIQVVVTRSRVYVLRQGEQGWPDYGQNLQYLAMADEQGLSGAVDGLFLSDEEGNRYTTDAYVQIYAKHFGLNFETMSIEEFADWAP